MGGAGAVADGALGVPAAPLRPLVTRYAGYRYLGFPPGVHLGMPTRSLTVVIALGPPTRMTTLPDPTAPPAEFPALASGLHGTAVGIGHDGDQFGVQLDVTPLGARALLGVPAGELAHLVLDLAEVLGPDASVLRTRMAAARDWPGRFAVLDEVLLRRAARGEARLDALPPRLRHAWALVVGGGGRTPVAELAREVGWSRRQLTVRFAGEFGLPPKELGRVVRFERSMRVLRSGRCRTVAEVAAVSGFYDQAHLAREWVAMAGVPPSIWLASEDLPSVQDAADAAGEAAGP